jgi:hypothetical protein
VPGTEFAVVGREYASESWRELARVRITGSDAESRTFVETIDPRVETVPANLLRFSVTFSSPMDEGSAAGRIRLLDEDGAQIPGALLEMPPELWDRRRRRLTMLVEPGRIKRGLQPNVLAGAPLREGGTVTLVVDSGIRDVTGATLVASAQRTYRVGAPIRSRIDPHRWNVSWPDEHSAALVVSFGRALDRALVARYLGVFDERGHPVAGDSSLDEDATCWTFTPANAGSARQLRVDARLEDVAGNSVRRVFDRDLQRSEDDGIGAPEIILTPGA